jgi:hypothetical protein
LASSRDEPQRPVSAAHAELMARLMRMRALSGLTTRDFAAAAAGLGSGVSWSQPKVTRVENGLKRPTRAEVVDWITVAGLDPAGEAEVLELADQLAIEAKPWAAVWADAGGAAARQGDYARWEAESHRIVVFQPVVVPGLLQTAEYARRVLTLFGAPAGEIPATVRARMDRAQVVYDPARTVVALITEAALRLRVASPQVMRGQLDHLLSLASLSNVELGVIPLDVDAPTLPWSAFVVFEMAEETVVTVEVVEDELTIRRDDQVARYLAEAEAWRGVARFGADASALIRAVQADLTDA